MARCTLQYKKQFVRSNPQNKHFWLSRSPASNIPAFFTYINKKYEDYCRLLQRILCISTPICIPCTIRNNISCPVPAHAGKTLSGDFP